MAMKPGMAPPFPPKKGMKSKKKKKRTVDSPAEEATETPQRTMMASGLTRKTPMGSGY